MCYGPILRLNALKNKSLRWYSSYGMPRKPLSKYGPRRIITVSLPPLIAKALDALVAQSSAESRSAYVKQLIENAVRRDARKHSAP